MGMLPTATATGKLSRERETWKGEEQHYRKICYKLHRLC